MAQAVLDAPSSASARRLTESHVAAIVGEAVQSLKLAGKRVLLIVPDDTRTCPIGLMVRTLQDALGEQVRSLDVLVALGTHQPMPIERIYRFLGIDAEYHRAHLPKTRFLNHAWDDPAQLRTIGTLSA